MNQFGARDSRGKKRGNPSPPSLRVVRRTETTAPIAEELTKSRVVLTPCVKSPQYLPALLRTCCLAHPPRHFRLTDHPPKGCWMEHTMRIFRIVCPPSAWLVSSVYDNDR